MIVLILCCVNHSFCADLQITIAQGIGNNPDAALKNALHQAVQQVVGTLVNSESLVKNDDLIKEEILTHSNGFVKNYQVMKKIHPLSNGMYSVTIKAEVVEQKLKENNLKTKLVLQIHDELVLDVPKEEITICKNILTQCMESVINLRVKLPVGINYAYSLYDC